MGRMCGPIGSLINRSLCSHTNLHTVYVTAEYYACRLSGWLGCNFCTAYVQPNAYNESRYNLQGFPMELTPQVIPCFIVRGCNRNCERYTLVHHTWLWTQFGLNNLAVQFQVLLVLCWLFSANGHRRTTYFSAKVCARLISEGLQNTDETFSQISHITL